MTCSNSFMMPQGVMIAESKARIKKKQNKTKDVQVPDED